MTSFFEDKKFDQLDWITQITEPVESHLSTLLANLPERFELTKELVIELHKSSLSLSSFTVSIRGILNTFSSIKQSDLSWAELLLLETCFKFEMSDSGVELDMGGNEMRGKIELVKTTFNFTDEQLLSIMGNNGINAVTNTAVGSSKHTLKRADEVLVVLGIKQSAAASKRKSRKIEAIAVRLRDIFTTNEWRIRDTILADKVGFWIAEYIKNGTLVCFANLYKLKVMTHNNMPIYSMAEEQ
jgi:hypothetical protein